MVLDARHNLCFSIRLRGVFQSGQMGQTVNLLLFSFGGSNPSAPTQYHKCEELRCGNLAQVFWGLRSSTQTQDLARRRNIVSGFAEIAQSIEH